MIFKFKKKAILCVDMNSGHTNSEGQSCYKAWNEGNEADTWSIPVNVLNENYTSNVFDYKNEFNCFSCGMEDHTWDVPEKGRECFMCIRLRFILSKLSSEDLERAKKETEKHIRKLMHWFLAEEHYFRKSGLVSLTWNEEYKEKFLDYKVGSYYLLEFDYLKHKLDPINICGQNEAIAVYMEELVVDEIIAKEPVFYPTVEPVASRIMGSTKMTFVFEE